MSVRKIRIIILCAITCGMILGLLYLIKSDLNRASKQSEIPMETLNVAQNRDSDSSEDTGKLVSLKPQESESYSANTKTPEETVISTDNQNQTGTGTPEDTKATVDKQNPTGNGTPKDTKALTENQNPTGSQSQAETQAPASTQPPAENQAPTGSQSQAETQTPTETRPSVSTQLPDGNLSTSTEPNQGATLPTQPPTSSEHEHQFVKVYWDGTPSCTVQNNYYNMICSICNAYGWDGADTVEHTPVETSWEYRDECARKLITESVCSICGVNLGRTSKILGYEHTWDIGPGPRVWDEEAGQYVDILVEYCSVCFANKE